MPSSQLLFLLAGFSFAASSFAYYPLNFSNTHGSHMVLQRGTGALVWGFGLPFAPVTLTLVGASGNVSTPGLVDSEGIWRVRLPPQAAGGPFLLRADCASTGESANLTDVLFGDVVLCGGQSNMALGMGEINNSSALIAAAANRPGIRILSPQYSAQNISQRQFVLEYAINWTSAANNGGAAVAGFSAVCYLTAASLYDEMGGAVPFGLIDTAVGGTMISLWLSGTALDECLPLLPFVPGPPWTLSWCGVAQRAVRGAARPGLPPPAATPPLLPPPARLASFQLAQRHVFAARRRAHRRRFCAVGPGRE
jgi:hypothetical protein